jgi:hypothetical protein
MIMRRKHSHQLSGGPLKSIRIILVTALLLTSTQTIAVAEPPVNNDPNQGVPGKFAEKVQLHGKCFGRTDFPHISKHFPGTVNVIAYTYCPGKGVLVESTLVRTYAGADTLITRSNKGIGKTTINIALKCVWKQGRPPIQYAINSTHKVSDGATGTTEWKKLLEC